MIDVYEVRIDGNQVDVANQNTQHKYCKSVALLVQLIRQPEAGVTSEQFHCVQS